MKSNVTVCNKDENIVVTDNITLNGEIVDVYHSFYHLVWDVDVLGDNYKVINIII